MVRQLFLAAVVVSLALPHGSARAQTPSPAPPGQPDEINQVKLLYDRGMAHFQLEEYDAAIEKWQAGFRIKPAPEFLYNIAQAYRLSRRPDRALSFYQKYLRMSPKAPNRAEVERHIAALQKVVDQQARSQPPTASPPNDRTSQVPEPEPSNPPSASPAVPQKTATAPAAPAPANPSSSAAPSAATLTATAPTPKTPIYKKGWFWGVMAGVALVVAGGVVAGVLASRSSEHALPDARF
jgi:tetratricopeptide (TPR) repeat protein